MNLHVQKIGKGSPIIILHGLYGSSDNWLTVAKQFENDFTIYLPDLRNHGKSPHTDSHTYSDMSQDLYMLIRKNFIRDPILIGHSMGGKVVIDFAQKYHELISKLIIVDISPKCYDTSDISMGHKKILEALLNIDLSNYKTRNEISESLVDEIPSKILRQFLLKNIDRASNSQFVWKINLKVLHQYLREIGCGPQYENLKPVNNQTLIIRGENSPYIDSDDQIKMAGYFPNGTIKSIPDAGHWLHAEKPDEFVQIIKDFIY